MGRLGAIFDLDQTLVSSQVNGHNFEIDRCSVYPGVMKALEVCRELDVPWIIVTNQSERRAKELVQRLFPGQITRLISAARKPDPGRTKMAKIRLHHEGVDQIIAFGDDPKDHQTAKECGFEFVGCHWGRDKRYREESRREFLNSRLLLKSELLPNLIWCAQETVRNEENLQNALACIDDSHWPQGCFASASNEQQKLEKFEPLTFHKSILAYHDEKMYKSFSSYKHKGKWCEEVSKNHKGWIDSMCDFIKASIHFRSISHCVLVPTISSGSTIASPNDEVYRLAEACLARCGTDKVSIDETLVKKNRHDSKHKKRMGQDKRLEGQGHRAVKTSNWASDPNALFLIVDDVLTTGGTIAGMAKAINSQRSFCATIGACTLMKYTWRTWRDDSIVPNKPKDTESIKSFLRSDVPKCLANQLSQTNPRVKKAKRLSKFLDMFKKE